MSPLQRVRFTLTRTRTLDPTLRSMVRVLFWTLYVALLRFVFVGGIALCAAALHGAIFSGLTS